VNGPARRPTDDGSGDVAGAADDAAALGDAVRIAAGRNDGSKGKTKPRDRRSTKPARSSPQVDGANPGLFDGTPPPERIEAPAPTPGSPSATTGVTPASSMQEASRGAPRVIAKSASRPAAIADRSGSSESDAALGATPSDARRGAAWMERMRPYRAIRQRDLSIGTEVLSIERTMGRRQDALGDVIEAWNRVAPPALARLVAIAGLARGTLTLSVAGSAASYELGRALRGGLERALVAELPGRVRRIKVVLSSVG
jgi:hypothetical protein